MLGTNCDAFVASYTRQMQDNLAAKEQLCLRAGDSVTGTARSDAQALAREWHFIGPVPAPASDALQARFECVRHASAANAL